MVTRARRKGGDITVWRVTEHAQIPPGVQLHTVEDGFKVWSGKHNSWVGVKLGDYIRVDDPDDIYPIGAEYFAANFDVVEEVQHAV